MLVMDPLAVGFACASLWMFLLSKDYRYLLVLPLFLLGVLWWVLPLVVGFALWRAVRSESKGDRVLDLGVVILSLVCAWVVWGSSLGVGLLKGDYSSQARIAFWLGAVLMVLTGIREREKLPFEFLIIGFFLLRLMPILDAGTDSPYWFLIFPIMLAGQSIGLDGVVAIGGLLMCANDVYTGVAVMVILALGSLASRELGTFGAIALMVYRFFG